MFFKLLQKANALFLIIVTLFGILTDSNALHPENKLSLISVRFCGKMILTSEEQFWKAQPPMLTTCSPIAILVAFEQEAK